MTHVTIGTSDDGGLTVMHGGSGIGLPVATIAYLRSHFQAEKDADLGRWRDPSAPTYVAYPAGNEVSVISEETGTWGQWSRHLARLEAGRDKLAAVAVRYFEAHDPAFQAATNAVWAALEPRLEDIIDLDLNVPEQNEQFAALVAAVARAVVNGDGE